jgi:hypothetical protein
MIFGDAIQEAEEDVDKEAKAHPVDAKVASEELELEKHYMNLTSLVGGYRRIRIVHPPPSTSVNMLTFQFCPFLATVKSDPSDIHKLSTISQR